MKKGEYHHSEEIKKIMSYIKREQVKNGIFKSWNTGITGYITSWRGGHHTNETKLKMQNSWKSRLPASEETNKKISLALKKHIKEKGVLFKLPKGGTSLEKKVMKELIKIGFIKENNIMNCTNELCFCHNQFLITKYSRRYPDILFPKLKIIIECDGKQWHKDKEKDKKRDEELNELGFIVCHLEEDVIRDDGRLNCKLVSIWGDMCYD